MKAQAVNVDWVVGLSIFLLAVVAATINTVQTSDVETDSGLKSKAEETAAALKTDFTTEASITPLYVRQPHEVGRTPFETSYHLENSGSGFLNTASRVNLVEDRIRAVVDSGNESYRLARFQSRVTHGFESNISGGERLENSYISLNPESGGLESIQLKEEEYLESRADLEEVGESTQVSEIYGSTFDRVRIYTGSREIVFDNLDTTFHFRNFSTLYWEADGSTIELSGEGEFRSGDTEGIVLSEMDGEDYTATFTGDMEARVFQDDDPGTKVEVNGSKVRLMLRESEIDLGKKRVENHVYGEIYFGVEEELDVATESTVSSLRGRSDLEFEREYDLQSFGYNTSGILERGSKVPLKPVAVESRVIPESSWNGSLEWSTLRVAIWQ